MTKDLDYYMNLPYRIEILEDKTDGGYVFRCPELTGCITCADTIDMGMKQIEDAKKEWLEACLEDSIVIPEPTTTEKYSGQFKLRLPKTLHRQLAQKSSEEGVSMNQYCVYLLSKGV